MQRIAWHRLSLFQAHSDSVSWINKILCVFTWQQCLHSILNVKPLVFFEFFFHFLLNFQRIVSSLHSRICGDRCIIAPLYNIQHRVSKYPWLEAFLVRNSHLHVNKKHVYVYVHCACVSVFVSKYFFFYLNQVCYHRKMCTFKMSCIRVFHTSVFLGRFAFLYNLCHMRVCLCIF